jgi:hypothetical protein
MFNLVCEKCGTRYDLVPGSVLNIASPQNENIICDACQSVLREPTRTTATFAQLRLSD